MTTKTIRRNINERLARAATLCLLGLVALLCPALEARAQWVTNGTNINNTNTGHVGVGTSTPDTPLGDTGAGKTVNVQSDSGYSMLRLTRGTAGSGEMGRVTFGSPAFTNAEKRTAVILSINETPSTADPSGSFRFYTTTAGTMTEKMRINSAGSIGIGTGTPGTFLGGISGSGRILHVANTTDHAQVFLSATGAGKLPAINMEVGDATATRRVFQTRYDGANNVVRSFFFNETTGAVTQDNVLTLKNDGNVGIGTANPGYALTVHKEVNGPSGIVVYNTATGGSWPQAFMGVSRTTDLSDKYLTWGVTAPTFAGGGYGETAYFHSRGVPMKFGTLSADSLHLFTNGVQNPRLTVSGAGNVGIGTTTPTTALHVVGDVTVTGNISAKYQDVAEWVPSTEKLAAGTVVVVNAEAVNHVQTSTSAYATSVAGVISPQPGLILGEAGEGKALVATTGRVKVRVDATRVPIRAGDLLVTSDVPGVAMRSEPVPVGGVEMHRPGTIIGKALEPLAGGTGEILVLLSLQ